MYYRASFRVPIHLTPGLIRSPSFSESATTCTSHLLRSARYEDVGDQKEVREEGRKRERARHPGQPVREKSRSFIGIRRFRPDVSSFLRDGTAAYGRRLGEIEYAVVAVVVALAYRYSLVMVASSTLSLVITRKVLQECRIVF